MIKVEELTPGAKALSPSAVIDLRNTLAGEARAARVRQLATPSWLSTRTKPIVGARRPLRRSEGRGQTARAERVDFATCPREGGATPKHSGCSLGWPQRAATPGTAILPGMRRGMNRPAHPPRSPCRSGWRGWSTLARANVHNPPCGLNAAGSRPRGAAGAEEGHDLRRTLAPCNRAPLGSRRGFTADDVHRLKECDGGWFAGGPPVAEMRSRSEPTLLQRGSRNPVELPSGSEGTTARAGPTWRADAGAQQQVKRASGTHEARQQPTRRARPPVRGARKRS